MRDVLYGRPLLRVTSFMTVPCCVEHVGSAAGEEQPEDYRADPQGGAGGGAGEAGGDAASVDGTETEQQRRWQTTGR